MSAAAALAELHRLALAGAEVHGVQPEAVSDLMSQVLRRASDDDLLSTLEAAAFIGRARNTLERWRSDSWVKAHGHYGPEYERDSNGRIWYRRKALKNFLGCE